MKGGEAVRYSTSCIAHCCGAVGSYAIRGRGDVANDELGPWSPAPLAVPTGDAPESRPFVRVVCRGRWLRGPSAVSARRAQQNHIIMLRYVSRRPPSAPPPRRREAEVLLSRSAKAVCCTYCSSDFCVTPLLYVPRWLGVITCNSRAILQCAPTFMLSRASHSTCFHSVAVATLRCRLWRS